MWFIVFGAALVCGQSYVGQVDTVGGTTYDWWFNGPIHRDIVNSPNYGLHVSWMYSAETTGTTFIDRNMRYNFYDYVSSAWNWIDPDFMQSGVNVYAERSGCGNLAADLTTGVAYISRHGGTPQQSTVARDIVPGAGIFEFAPGDTDLNGTGPVIAMGEGDRLHMVAMSSAYNMTYARMPTWPTWDTVMPLQGGLDYNIAASKVSPKVFICWTDNMSPVSRAYWRLSEDGGTTWGPQTELAAPPAYGGDTVTSFHITSLFPFYDAHDHLHVAVNVIPGCAPEHLLGEVGYNATYACRPSMGEDTSGNLFVVWEQFDSSNIEPLTGWLRASIWAAWSYSEYNGALWSPALRLTPPTSASHRFPCVIDRAQPDGSMWPATQVLYLMDPIAGFFVQDEHHGVRCPVVVQWPEFRDAIQDAPTPSPDTRLRIWPNPASQTLHIAGGQRLVLLDVAGRERARLHDGTNDIGTLPPGIYVVRDEQTRLSRKLVVRP